MLVASEWQALAHQALQALTSLVPRYKRGPAGGADLAGLALPFDALRGAKRGPAGEEMVCTGGWGAESADLAGSALPFDALRGAKRGTAAADGMP